MAPRAAGSETAGGWSVLAGLLGGPVSSSGVRVTAETALTSSPWWRGVSLLAAWCEQVPLVTYRLNDTGKTPDRQHPAYPLLLHKANPFQTAGELRNQLTAHALSWGNGYAYVYRDGAGRPLELWPLDPSSTYPVREDLYDESGARSRVWYVVETPKGQRKLPAEDVIHLKGLSHDGLSGLPVYAKAAESLGLDLAQKKYQTVFYRNSGRASVVLTTPNKLMDKAKLELRESWERMHSGLDNSHRTAILDNGLAVAPLTGSPEDAQLIQGRQFSIKDIANWLNLPPHKLGDDGQTGYASLEQVNQSFLDESLNPWYCRWEGQCRDKLLTEQEKQDDSHAILFDRARLLHADLPARANYYSVALAGAPWMTRDEVRGREDLPLMGGVAAELVDPKNMGQDAASGDDPPPVPKPKPKPKPAGPNKALAAAVRAGLEDAARRVVKRVTLHARRTAKDSAAYCNWLDSFRSEHQHVAAEMLAAALGTASAAADRCAYPSHVAALDVLHDEVHATLSALIDACTPAQLPAAVDAACAALEADAPARLAARWSAPEEE